MSKQPNNGSAGSRDELRVAGSLKLGVVPLVNETGACSSPLAFRPSPRRRLEFSAHEDYDAARGHRMSEFEKVADVSELPPGSCRAYLVGGRKIAVFHAVGGFFATDDACPHRGGPLSEGDILGDEVVCPWHLWSFRLDTGINPGSPVGGEVRVRTHEVRVDGDAVVVRLTKEENE